MKPEIKELWIAVLRNGEYRQGKDALRTEDDHFCCLGVLCDLHAKAGLGRWDGYNYEKQTQVLPSAVRDWAGLDEEIPIVDGKALTVLNDGDGGYDEEEGIEVIYEYPTPFAEIADLIETHL